MTLLSGLGVNELTSPELTGGWEHQLKQIEHRQLDRQAFMREIAQMTQVIVKRAKEYERDTVPGDYATLSTPCPKCGSVVKENYRRYACTNCDFSIGKHPGGRTFEIAEVEELLQKREIGPLSGFISKMGRPFAAILRITGEYKLEFDFGQSDADDAEAVDFSGHTALGSCPKCGHAVYEHGMNYVCEKSVGPDKSCDFRSGKVILQQEISAEQFRKLLADGRTDLLDGFVSSRTNRKFKAFLVKQPNGKIGFEFEPRPQKPGAKTAAKSAVKSAAAAGHEAGAAPAKAAKKAPARKAAAKKAPAKKAAAKTATKTAAKRASKTAAKTVTSSILQSTPDDDDPPF
jgi:DNA topoisomerase-3